MDPHKALGIVTVVGLCVGFLALVISQFWKTSVDVDGTIRKRLTLPGWICLFISLVGFLTGVLAVYIRSQTPPEKPDSTPPSPVGSTEPLTSLLLHLQFSSTDPELWKTMQDGQKDIQENNESTQAGVPSTPYENMEYQAELVPLLSFLARVGTKTDDNDIDEHKSRPPDKRSIAVLISLDESRNAILSFGEIDSRVSWLKSDEAGALSAGFYTSRLRKEPRKKPRHGEIPYVSTTLSQTAQGTSTYAIDWKLNPVTLAASVDRMNSAIPATARLPTVLKIALLFDMKTLPFKEGDFSVNYVDLWSSGDHGSTTINPNDAIRDFELVMTLNGSRALIYRYGLKRIYRQELLYDGVDEAETRCTILEFQMR